MYLNGSDDVALKLLSKAEDVFDLPEARLLRNKLESKVSEKAVSLDEPEPVAPVVSAEAPELGSESEPAADDESKEIVPDMLLENRGDGEEANRLKVPALLALAKAEKAIEDGNKEKATQYAQQSLEIHPSREAAAFYHSVCEGKVADGVFASPEMKEYRLLKDEQENDEKMSTRSLDFDQVSNANTAPTDGDAKSSMGAETGVVTINKSVNDPADDATALDILQKETQVATTTTTTTTKKKRLHLKKTSRDRMHERMSPTFMQGSLKARAMECTRRYQELDLNEMENRVKRRAARRKKKKKRRTKPTEEDKLNPTPVPTPVLSEPALSEPGSAAMDIMLRGD